MTKPVHMKSDKTYHNNGNLPVVACGIVKFSVGNDYITNDVRKVTCKRCLKVIQVSKDGT
jgi:hypothetical protein